MADSDASLPSPLESPAPIPPLKQKGKRPQQRADFLHVSRQVQRLQRAIYDAAQGAAKDVAESKSLSARDAASRRLVSLSEQWIKITETRRIVLGLPHPDKVSPDERKQRGKHRGENWSEGISDAGGAITNKELDKVPDPPPQ